MEIVINKLSYKFKKNIILDEIDLELTKGVYGLLGPNGAGKTTMLRCITGIYKTKYGMVQQNNINLMGYVPQNFGLIHHLTVYENLEYIMLLKKINKKNKDAKAHILECIEKTGLLEQKDKKCGKLSGGMLRRLGIAQALLGNPELIVLDEPLVGLDIEEKRKIKNVLQEIGKESIIMISTHMLDDAQEICENIIMLYKGKTTIFNNNASDSKKLEETYLCLLKEM